ncbi:ABC transporter permease [Heliorestis convoluta]|uniref:Bacitracin transport permease protein BcrB n=1 Tax=Heliorestis convoluta TaxID=356322 RepID=A0A5Q2MZZ9_9FIRM|nr:ABC transporter permease [Heliorestis convoluta]QGG46816.1 Bacitracin transport permease protein BcrB [Heliorestis convoluta]
MIKLVLNEIIKLLGKRRLLVVTLIMAMLIAVFTYAQAKEIERTRERLGTEDWRTTLQQQIIDTQNRLSSTRISDEWKQQLQIRIAQQQYYLDNDINPTEPGAPTFLRGFVENSIQLLLPLMVMVIAADLVSSEKSIGTIKLLLTRPVKRWRILLSKYITLILAVSFIIFIFGLIGYLISGLVFGYKGWMAPIITGFSVQGGELDTASTYIIPQWQYLLMIFGLAWFVSLVVGTLSFLLSVLIKSTAAGMGIMLAALIAGTILSNMVSSWETAKYLFMVNLNLTSYLTGQGPPIEGMTLGFSMAILTIWALGALFLSFFVFTKQDVY